MDSVAEDTSVAIARQKVGVRIQLTTAILGMYMALRNKFGDEEMKRLKDLDDWVVEDASKIQPTIAYLYSCYKMIQDKLEELGITKFEKKMLPAEQAVFED